MKATSMKTGFGFAFLATAMVCFGAIAGGEEAEVEERETFGKWHFGIGAAFNGGVKAHLGARNLPMPRMYSVPGGSTRADAWSRAAAHRYDGGGYIAPDSLDNGYATENWKLPVSAYRGDGRFDLGNSYQEVVGSSSYNDYRDSSDPTMQYGISFEIARELWVYDENAAHRWGVDFAAAFSYFFQRNVYGARGTVMRTDTVRDGTIRTEVNDPDAMWKYDNGLDAPIGGMYGHGNYDYNLYSPALGWDSIGAPSDVGGPTHTVSSSYNYNASGDYQELEMLFMFRPWYEITDWWRVFAEVGVGVSWGRFSCSFSSESFSSDETFNQWDCYGVAGLGTVFRYGRFDLGIDFLGRFLRRDLDVDGQYVNGTIERSPWGFRIMLGYSF